MLEEGRAKIEDVSQAPAAFGLSSKPNPPRPFFIRFLGSVHTWQFFFLISITTLTALILVYVDGISHSDIGDRLDDGMAKIDMLEGALQQIGTMLATMEAQLQTIEACACP